MPTPPLGHTVRDNKRPGAHPRGPPNQPQEAPDPRWISPGWAKAKRQPQPKAEPDGTGKGNKAQMAHQEDMPVDISMTLGCSFMDFRRTLGTRSQSMNYFISCQDALVLLAAQRRQQYWLSKTGYTWR
uniref:Uncharacterized protein n=1 Tax=Eutreptiella gymnastica TaxID=73025 RepID=A0A6U8H0Y6_9EUGL|mmetsp:Transcript_52768/g.94183  ORF Transcript_52768/g.94183 Transcript_52768/m.94183 type:complete len:128 (+) Transcript_52768:785-1168(+)